MRAIAGFIHVFDDTVGIISPDNVEVYLRNWKRGAVIHRRMRDEVDPFYEF